MTDPKPDDEFEIRSFRPGDEPRLLELHNQVFPGERSREHWNWKFRDNPVGIPHIVVADAGEAGIVGTFSALPAFLWIDGEKRIAAQGVDLTVLPEWRRRPKRPGMFVHLSRYYLDHHLGREPEQALLTYGWPVPNWRIGQRYLDYQMVCNWDMCFREVGVPGFAPLDPPGDLEVREVDRFVAADLDPLFERLKQEMPVLLDPSAATLNWRFVDCPDRDYRLYECREARTGALRGVCVYRVADFMVDHTAFLMEWVVPRDDDAATRALVSALERQAQRDVCPALACTWNAMDPRLVAFQRLGWLVRGTSYFLVVQTFQHDVVFLRENWFYTMGDCDML